MAEKSRFVRLGVVVVALGALSAVACGNQQPLSRASVDPPPAFPGTFAGCGARDGIPTTGCVIVRNHTRGWTGPGVPRFAGGFVLRATGRTALTTGGSNGWVQPMQQQTRRSAAAEPVLNPGIGTVWAGAWCRTAAARCKIITRWTIGAAIPRPFEAAIRQRNGDGEFVAQMRTSGSGTSNRGDVTGTSWVALTPDLSSTRGQNARMLVTATNYTVRVVVRNRVRDQQLQFNPRPNTTSAVEIVSARLPQSLNRANLMNGSLVLAPMVNNTPGEGEYGYITRVNGRVEFRMEFEWIGSSGVPAIGNRADVTVGFDPAAPNLVNSGTCNVAGSFAPTCSVNLTATTSDGASVDIIFEER